MFNDGDYCNYYNYNDTDDYDDYLKLCDEEEGEGDYHGEEEGEEGEEEGLGGKRLIKEAQKVSYLISTCLPNIQVVKIVCCFLISFFKKLRKNAN